MDTILLLVAFLCQVAGAWMGYTVSTRPPAPKNKIYFECGFIGIAIIGALSIAISGYRSGVVQNQILGGIEQLLHPGAQDASIQDAKNIITLFNQVDPNIMDNVEQGNFNLSVRMQPNDLAQLRNILTQDSSQPPLVVIKNVGPPLFDDLIDNGTLGTQSAAPIQYEVFMHIDKSLVVDGAH